MNQLLRIPGIQTDHLLFETPRSWLYRGVRIKDQRRVVIKQSKPMIEEKYNDRHLRHEFDILKRLQIPGVVVALDVVSNSPSSVLIFEDFEGFPLTDFIPLQGFSTESFLPVAIKIATILEAIHRNKIIHLEIKPQNILFNPRSSDILFIDFEKSTRLSEENISDVSLELSKTSLAYYSPEQTGRMNRSVDLRSDLYSLGILFYELLTGKPPFQSEDPLQLLHAHIAKQPISLHHKKADIPIIISNLVAKLLEKMPENRYQTTGGLLFDLQAIQDQLKNQDPTIEIELGHNDQSDKLQIPQNLIGRETELQLLTIFHDNVIMGDKSVAIISGPSGIGKTSVSNELKKRISYPDGFFISGKCDQYDNQLPFSAFTQAFTDWIHQLLTLPDKDVDKWKELFYQELGDHLHVLSMLIPQIELIMGGEKEFDAITFVEAKNLFELVFKKVLSLFKLYKKPVIIFLDDVQWMDSGTANLLHLIRHTEEIGYVFLMLGYRHQDNEKKERLISVKGQVISLFSFVQELSQKDAHTAWVELQPLSILDVNKYISQTISCDLEYSLMFAQYVHQKTDGNPYFIGQFLKILQQNSALWFDYDVLQWKWDLQKIREMEITDNVIDLMTHRLRRLSSDELRLITIASCIGFQFELEMVSDISGYTSQAALELLWNSLEENILIPLGSNYKYLDEQSENMTIPQPVVSIKFAHDKVLQAAYEFLSMKERNRIHYQIGRYLLDKIDEPHISDHVFQLVTHLNLGYEWIEATEEKVRVSELNLIAGIKARNGTAYDSAISYLQQGIQCLGSDPFNIHYVLCFQLHLNLSECFYLTGHHEQSTHLYQQLLAIAKSATDKVKVLEIRLVLLAHKGQHKEAIETAAKALTFLGFRVPKKSKLPIFLLSLLQLSNKLSNASIDSQNKLPEMTSETHKSAMEIISAVGPSASFVDPVLLAYLVVKQLKWVTSLGHPETAGSAYVGFGVILASLGKYEMAYRMGEIANFFTHKLNKGSRRFTTLFTQGVFLLLWKQPLRDSKDMLVPVLQNLYENGYFSFVGYTANYLGFIELGLSPSLDDAQKTLSNYRVLLVQTGQDLNLNTVYHRYISNLKGKTEHAESFSVPEQSEESFVQQLQASENKVHEHWFWILKIEIAIFDQNFKSADTFLLSARKVESASKLHFALLYQQFLELIICYRLGVDVGKKNSVFKKLKKLSKLNPDNFEFFYLIVVAEKYRNDGKYWQAIDYYERASHLPQQGEFKKWEAYVVEQIGRLYIKKLKPDIGYLYIFKAVNLWKTWQADRMVARLRNEYRDSLIQNSQQLSEIIQTLGIGSGSEDVSKLDIHSIVQSGLAIISEIKVDHLVNRLLEISAGVAGAERVIIILESQGQWIVEAVWPEKNVPQHMLLETFNLIPHHLVDYVKRTKSPVIIGDLAGQSIFKDDPYFHEYQIRSVMMIPLLRNMHLTGMIYLENRLINHAFTPGQFQLLNILGSQSAIAFENARLYREMDERIRLRTTELMEKNDRLEETLKQLKQAQVQLFHSAKMASVGQLTAGIAHEINNPVNFITASSDALLADLKELQEIADKEFKTPSKEWKVLMDEITMMIEAVSNGAKRTAEIVKGLQLFTRKNDDAIKKWSVKDSIEQALELLTSSFHNRIEIVRHYGPIRDVDASSGEMNQVLIALLTNAIDAISGNGTITISTTESEDGIIIIISDTGIGMSKDQMSRCFEPFFTTKPIGKGTGLGLAIAYAIIQRHNGKIDMTSEEGVGTSVFVHLPFIQPTNESQAIQVAN